jgi:hypothetical protein
MFTKLAYILIFITFILLGCRASVETTTCYCRTFLPECLPVSDPSPEPPPPQDHVSFASNYLPVSVSLKDLCLVAVGIGAWSARRIGSTLIESTQS